MDIEFNFGITLGTGLHRPERAVVGRSYPGVSSENRAAGAMEHMGAAALLELYVPRGALNPPRHAVTIFTPLLPRSLSIFCAFCIRIFGVGNPGSPAAGFSGI